MRVFTASCIDKETGYDVRLSECSYNMACDWLMWKGYAEPLKVTTSSGGRFQTITFKVPENHTFVYDEERGFLLQAS